MQFSIQLIGGTGAGRTSFLTAFAHQYIEKSNRDNATFVFGEPENLFESIGNLFQTRTPDASFSGTTQTYSLVHKYGKAAAKDNLVFYDIPGEVIVSGSYERNPKNFGFCDGVIFIIDPTGAQDDHSTNANTVISQFVQQFEKIRGLSIKKMKEIPVAVVINKIDLEAVASKLGASKLTAQHDSSTIDKACMGYLKDIGLDGAVKNIDANFSNVRYFPVSATGAGDEGVFKPVGVVAPVLWIAGEGRANMARLLASVDS